MGNSMVLYPKLHKRLNTNNDGRKIQNHETENRKTHRTEHKEHKPKTHLLPTCHQQYQHPIIHPKQGKYNAERPKIQYKSKTQKLDQYISHRG